jgi:hypothetical protein
MKNTGGIILFLLPRYPAIINIKRKIAHDKKTHVPSLSYPLPVLTRQK